MLVDECFLKFLPKDCPIPIVLNGPEAYEHRTLSALRSNLRAEASPAGSDETASLLFTSGTSGPSKACELTHEYFINAAKRLVTSLRLRSDDVLFCPFPLYHADATSFTVVPALLLGATAAISQRFSASGWWNEIRQTRSTVADFMGATLSILYKAEPTPSDPDNPLRIMWGVPVPSWVEEFEKRFALKVYEVYGSTETGLPVVQNNNKPRIQGSCGVALPNAELKIVDENMQEVQFGVVGELLVRQPPEFMFSGEKDLYAIRSILKTL
jgi:crotonobetaine/carnitine-CoA ligase